MFNLLSISSGKLSFKRFNRWLFLILLVRMLIPAIYNNIRVSILGTLSNNTKAIKVVSQLTWVQIALEVFEEALLLPLYYCFGSAMNNDETLQVRFRSGLSICVLFYAVFSGILAAATPQLVQLMGQENDLVPETTIYLRLELGSIFTGGLAKFADLFLVIKKKSKFLMVKLIVEMVCAITFDIFFFSNLSVSLKLGTKGVAYSSLAKSCIILLIGLSMAFITIKLKMRQFLTFNRSDYSWLTIWSKQGLFSGLDSLIRNSVYALIVIRGMNLLNAQDTYWIANTFIWSWLLLPVLALSEMLKQDIATSHPQQTYRVILPAYVYLSLSIVLMWIVTIPGWKPFISGVLNASDPSAVSELVYQLMPGYVFFIISSMTRAIFYAKGKIEYIVISSFIASIFLVILFLLVIFKVLPSNIKIVAGIFEANMVVGSLAAIFLMMRFMKRSTVHVAVQENSGVNDGDVSAPNQSERALLNEKSE